MTARHVVEIRKRFRVGGLFAARLSLIVAVVLGLGLSPALMSTATAAQVNLLGGAAPRVVSDPDTRSVELGMRFSSDTAGSVTGVRFYQGPHNRGPHTGTLWSANGRRLAVVHFPKGTDVGWRTAKFAKPVKIAAGKRYVVSYSAPHGRYAGDNGYFATARTSGHLTAPVGGGVYSYPRGHFPKSNWENSNYFVDVLFQPGKGAVIPPAATESPTSTPTPTPTPSEPASSPPTAGADLNLPRIPWEGGSAYWKQFKNANAAGWSDPSFFPIVAWYDGISSNPEVVYDKSVGVNTYVGMDPSTPYSLFKDNDSFWIGDKLNSSFTSSSTNWVGDFLDDEVDGRYSPAAGEAYLQSLDNKLGNDGRFKYANFTQEVIGTELNQADARKYVNDYTDVTSVDLYWYTVPFCDQTPYRGGIYVDPVSQANCRTSSSYGKVVKSLRIQDATDGKLQPIWSFVENLNGGPGPSAPAKTITPGQLQGAVMNSVINEARGIVYFNQSLSGSCQTGNVFRQSMVTPKFCGDAQVAGAKEVDSTIHVLAPVINTQSYQYSFGAGLNTMLKTYDGSAYIFSMIDGSSQPGSRTFHLPPGVAGRSVQVLNENRTIPVDASGTFTDSFAKEYTYHIYKVSLGSN